MKEIIFKRIFILCIFIVLVGIMISFVSLYSFSKLGENAIKIYSYRFSDGKNNLNYRMLKHGESGNIIFNTNINMKELKKAGTENYAVLIYKLNCQAYIVYFNDVFLGSIGDMKTGNSNIWNSINYFYIDNSILKENNQLKIEINSLYDVGLSSLPVYIMDVSQINNYKGKIYFFTQGIHFISIGLNICAIIIIFMLYLVSCQKSTSFLYFSSAILLIGIFTLDRVNFYTLPFNYLIYKKFIFLALYGSITAASMGMYKFFHNKVDKIIAILTLVGIILIEIFSKDMITFKNIYNHYNFVIIVNLLSWIRTAYINLKNSEEAKIFFVVNIFFVLFVTGDIYITIKGNIFNSSVQFTYTFIFSIISIILLFSEYLKKENELDSINVKQEVIYKKSITDGMTGLYNHTHMVNMIKKTVPPYSVVMLDIDNFKNINDSLGHYFGDVVISQVAFNLKKQIRSNDLVFRYGGDEFLIILFKCTDINAREIMIKIIKYIESNSLEIDGKIVSITLSGGIYYVRNKEDYKDIFRKVDSALYYSKNKGKNCISVYKS